jgi:hypothetical protein
MKIKVFRIIYSIIFVITFALFIFLLIDAFNLQQSLKTGNVDFLLNISGFAILSILNGYEIYWFLRSFKKGSEVMPYICFNKKNKINLPVFIVSIVLGAFNLFLFVWFFLAYIGINPIYPSTFSKIDLSVFFSIGLYAFLNFASLFIYTLFVKDDSVKTEYYKY